VPDHGRRAAEGLKLVFVDCCLREGDEDVRNGVEVSFVEAWSPRPGVAPPADMAARFQIVVRSSIVMY
jgi:hypothetical protein